MTDSGKLSFWEHLDLLRAILLKVAAVTAVFSVIAFIFKDLLFAIVLAPKEPDFITYRLFAAAGGIMPGDGIEDFQVTLVNTQLADQFLIHMKTALCFGILCASPYIIYQLYRFVSPALYTHEKQYAIKTVGNGYLMFLTGVLVSYFLIFPLTFRFLGTYQVAGDVSNLISLQSYMSTLIIMSITMGIVFEMPVLAWIFSKMGFISASFMRKYRKHAIVVILTIAAIITPTSDIFTLLLVSLPMWLLYESSILIIRNGRGSASSTDLSPQTI